MGVFDLGSSWTISSNLKMPPPVVATWSAYIDEIPMPTTQAV
jgi:hypothetical protein